MLRVAPCPAPSVPWATRMSAPAATAAVAIASDCTWQITAAPARRMRSANGAGSPNESITAAGSALEHQVEQTRLVGQAPGDEADAVANLRGGEPVELARQPELVAVAAAEDAEAAGPADGRGQRGVGDEVHRCEQHRMVDGEAAGQ